MLGLPVRPWTIGVAIAVASTTALLGSSIVNGIRDRQAVTFPRVVAGIPLVRTPTKSDPNAWYELGSGPTSTSFQVTMMRTDLRGTRYEKLAAPPYTRIGSATCTDTYDIPDHATGYRSTRRIHSGLVMCWRNTTHLSVVVLASAPGNQSAAFVDALFARS